LIETNPTYSGVESARNNRKSRARIEPGPNRATFNSGNGN
jgi:hypothetical protein